MIWKKYSFLLCIFISFIVLFRWFFFPELTHDDWSFVNIETAKTLISFPLGWAALFNFGGINLAATGCPYYLMYGVLALFSFSSYISDKIIFYLPIKLGVLLCTNVLIKNLFKIPVDAIIG